jgi:hypothetical protein
MEAIIKIGECFWLGACVLAFFLFLSLFSSVKFGILFKFGIPIFGFLIGMCMGAFLGFLFSPTAAQLVAIPAGILGVLISSSMLNQSQG